MPVESRHKHAFAAARDELAARLGVTLPAQWPEFPEAFVPPPGDPVIVEVNMWGGYFFIDPEVGVLVGNGGFHGLPDPEGVVEVGYEIASPYRNRGYATEAVRGLVRFAFEDPRARRIVAHTLAEKNASNAVLARIGMKFAQEVANDEVGKVWRWELPRS